MAIVKYVEEVYGDLIGKQCFYCFAPVYPPAVMWMGASAEMLLLHPGCVIELFLRLGRDVWEIECKTGQYFALPGALYSKETKDAR